MITTGVDSVDRTLSVSVTQFSSFTCIRRHFSAGPGDGLQAAVRRSGPLDRWLSTGWAPESTSRLDQQQVEVASEGLLPVQKEQWDNCRES